MTYIEWRDELASYLVGISDTERKKIFDYYAEMYADKRDAGLEEEQIIAEFGAPYDVARRISDETPQGQNNTQSDTPQQQDETPQQNEADDTTTANNGAQTPAKTVAGKAKHYIKILLLIAAIAALILFELSTVCTAVTYVIDGSLYLVYGETGNGLSMLGLGLAFIGISVILIALLTGVEKRIIKAIKTTLHGEEKI